MNAYVQNHDRHQKYTFFHLQEIMDKLNHTVVNILKFDIEGFEWNLFYTEILAMKNSFLPEQVGVFIRVSSLIVSLIVILSCLKPLFQP